MLPHIQLDDFDNNSGSNINSFSSRCLLLSDANQILRIDLNKIRNYIPTKFQNEQLKMSVNFFNKNLPIRLNRIAISESLKIFEPNKDVKSFKKKDNLLVSFSQ